MKQARTYKKRSTTKKKELQDRKGRVVVYPGHILPGGWLRNRRIPIIELFLSKDLSPIWNPPAHGVCTRKTKVQNIWFWRLGRLFFQENHKAVEIHSILKGHAHNLTHTRIHGRSSHMKGARFQTYLLILQNLEEEGGNWSLPWWHRSRDQSKKNT